MSKGNQRTPLSEVLGNCWILLRKELVIGMRTPSLYLLVGVPVVVSVILRVIMAGEAHKPARLAVVGAKKPVVVALAERVAKLGKKRPFKVVKVSSERKGRKLLQKGKLHGLLVLPPDFDARLKGGKRPEATLYFDETRGSSAYMLRTILRELFRVQAGQKEPARLKAVGIRRIKPWKTMLPAWVVMVILSTLTLMPSSISTERQSRTIQAVLVAPVTFWEFVVGKALFGMSVGVLGSVLVLLVNSSMQGNILLALTVVLVGSAVSTLAGIFVGLVIESAQGSAGVGSMLYIPLLWGAFFADMGGVVGAVSRAMPSYFMSEGLKRSLYMDGRWADSVPLLVVLAGLAVALTAACVWALTREQERY
jgi:ABC-2 type transport system permease protein